LFLTSNKTNNKSAVSYIYSLFIVESIYLPVLILTTEKP